jgi:hypothetical protein
MAAPESAAVLAALSRAARLRDAMERSDPLVRAVAVAREALRHCDPRSAAYKAGMVELLRRRFGGSRGDCPYVAGSAEFDAYCSGIECGWGVWRECESL